MSSRIEQLIDDIEEYIDSCKFQPFSANKIIVNKDDIQDLIHELRAKTPDEIKRVQRIIQNKDEILNDARSKAEQLINEATIQTTELISEHEIMQQAYAQAGEILSKAQAQAQEIVESAVMDANGMRSSAVEYTDQLLGYVQNVIESAISTYSANYETLINDLKQYQEIIISNRQELVQTPETSEDDLLEYDNNSSSDDGLANLDLI